MYDFRTLSPIDFENLVRDLLQAEFGIRLESFGPGRDQGIDFRFSSGGDSTIVQAKHYLDSGANALIAAMRRENLKVKRLTLSRYILATSVSLTNMVKSKILEAMPGCPLTLGDILGREDLNNLLTKHPQIERGHFKLWLSSTCRFGKLHPLDSRSPANQNMIAGCSQLPSFSSACCATVSSRDDCLKPKSWCCGISSTSCNSGCHVGYI
jgi:hypothetical protein